MKKRRIKDDENLYQPKLNRKSILKLEGLQNSPETEKETSPILLQYLNPAVKNNSNLIPPKFEDTNS